MSVKICNGLLTHNCHFRVGEVQRLEQNHKDLGIRLVQCWQVPDILNARQVKWLPYEDMEVNWTYTYQF